MYEEFNEDTVKRLLKTVDAGLTRGKGSPIPGKMCVEAAVCYALGMPHSDNPTCVDKAVRAFKIRLNDSTAWPSGMARAKGLRKVAVAQLGSKGAIDSNRFAEIVSIETVKCILPLVLKNLTTKRFSKEQVAAFNQQAQACEEVVTLAQALKAAQDTKELCRNAAAAAAYAANAANAANAAAAT